MSPDSLNERTPNERVVSAIASRWLIAAPMRRKRVLERDYLGIPSPLARAGNCRSCVGARFARRKICSAYYETGSGGTLRFNQIGGPLPKDPLAAQRIEMKALARAFR